MGHFRFFSLFSIKIQDFQDLMFIGQTVSKVTEQSLMYSWTDRFVYQLLKHGEKYCSLLNSKEPGIDP